MLAEIPGVSIDFTDYTDDPSIPRTVHIPNTLEEATVQDITDTLSAEQAKLDNLIYDNLLDVPGTSGKQDLGGGVLVGLTTTMNHVKISFDARKIATASGTITTGDANGITLNDSGGLFVGLVDVGAWVENLTDGSVATVLRVVSNTQIITDGLGGGTDNQFDITDSYKIRNVIQTEAMGGNLVAVDELGDPADAILPTAGTQALRTSSASATLLQQEALQHASYNGGVTVKPSSSYSGTEFPIGTLQQPVNNMADAVAIAAAQGLNRFYFLEDITLTNEDLTNSCIHGVGARAAVTVTLGAGVTLTNTDFHEVTITGTTTGLVQYTNCKLEDLTGRIMAIGCSLAGDITLAAGQSTIADCHSMKPGNDSVALDFVGAGRTLNVRCYAGGFTVKNMSDASNVATLGYVAGRCIVDPSCTAGELSIRGTVKVIDNSTGTDVEEVVPELNSGEIR